jgi:DNA repair protein RadC
MSINSWPKSERPRERLIKYGAIQLTNAELLAIFLRTGVRGKSAIDLARELLIQFGGINKILACDYKSFTSVNGLGPAKYCQLQATLELVKRQQACQVEESEIFTNQETVSQYLINHFPNQANEKFACLFLDTKHKLLNFKILFNGTINQSQVYPRVVAQNCLKENAAAVIFAHNHPSGCLIPSNSDKLITDKLIQALALIDVRVLDHFIIGNFEVQSMAQLGLI